MHKYNLFTTIKHVRPILKLGSSFVCARQPWYLNVRIYLFTKMINLCADNHMGLICLKPTCMTHTHTCPNSSQKIAALVKELMVMFKYSWFSFIHNIFMDTWEKSKVCPIFPSGIVLCGPVSGNYVSLQWKLWILWQYVIIMCAYVHFSPVLKSICISLFIYFCI